MQTTGQQFNIMCTFFEIVEFHADHIWNHNEKCIKISTNMPGIGVVIPEITCEMLELCENKHNFAQ